MNIQWKMKKLEKNGKNLWMIIKNYLKQMKNYGMKNLS